MHRIRLALACAALLLFTPAALAKDLHVVASFSVLGDVVKAIAGDRVAVATLVGLNGDPHEYEPSPDDAKRLRGADLVFVSGFGLEGWLDRLVAASGFAAAPVVVSAGIAPRAMAEDGGRDDPHVWNDPRNVARWASAIEAALAAADPEDAATYKANADSYRAALADLDAYARTALNRTPRKDRRILTSHDAFGYFGAAYGITFLSPLGLSTESEASARDVAQLIDQIRAERIRTYFIENSNDPRLVRQIAAATGAEPGGALYVESLSGPDGPAPTYLRMLRHDVDQIAAALAPTN